MDDQTLMAFSGTWFLIIGPYLFYFLAKYAFKGLFKGNTLTHFGMRSGWLARIYGVFYSLLLIFFILGYIDVAPLYLNLGLAVIINTLLLPWPRTENSIFLGFLFIGIGLFSLLLNWLVLRFVAWRYPTRLIDPKNARASKAYLFNYVGTIELSGILILIGGPLGLLPLVIGASVYVLPVLGINIEDIYPPEPKKTMSNSPS